MLGGLFLAAKAQNLFIDVGNSSQGYIEGSRLSFAGAVLGSVDADISASKSAFNLSAAGNSSPPKLLPHFAIHEIYGVASGGGGGGSSDFYVSESGEGGRAGQPYSVLAKLFAPVMQTQFCIINQGGAAGVNSGDTTIRKEGGNGRTEIANGFLFSVKTPVVIGAGGRKFTPGITLNAAGEQSSSPPNGNGGDGGIGNTSGPQAGNAGSVLCRGMVW